MYENKEHRTVLLTGSTGSLGGFLATELLKYDNIQLILLVRGKSVREARSRVQNIVDQGGDKVEVFCSHLNEESLGLSEKDYKDISQRVTHILHSAASTRFNNPLEEARLHNVKTTEQIISFAKHCPDLIRFGYLSTVFVAGNRSGIIMEDEFEHNAGFKNTYEQTKYEAEELMRKASKELPIVIFRLPFIVTPVDQNSKTQPNYLTVLISLVARGYLPFVPGTKESVMDVVNGFDAARIIVKLLLKNHLSYMTYHIANGKKAFTIGTFHRMIEEKLGRQVLMEYCGNMESFLQRISEIPDDHSEVKVAYKRSASFLSEPAYSKVFDNHNTFIELNISKIGEDPVNIFRSVLDSVL